MGKKLNKDVNLIKIINKPAGKSAYLYKKYF